MNYIKSKKISYNKVGRYDDGSYNNNIEYVRHQIKCFNNNKKWQQPQQ